MALWIQNITEDFHSRSDNDLHDYALRVNQQPPLAYFRHVRSKGAAACLRAAADALDAENERIIGEMAPSGTPLAEGPANG